MGSTETGTEADGRVVKRAVDHAQATRIRAEAEVLAAGRMPGVVELVGLEGDADQPVLVTARVDGPDLDRAGDLTLEEVAGVVAALATTLADLHDLGLVHGAVMPTHVLIGTDGRPVLCGFGYGGRRGVPPVGEAPLPDGYGDPARRPGDPLAPSSDVYALGVLLRGRLADTVPSSPAARPRRERHRFLTALRHRSAGARLSPRRRPSERVARQALAAVADRATAAEPRFRLGARSLAQAVNVAVPDAHLPRRVDVERPAPEAPVEPTALEERRPLSAKPPSAGSEHRGRRRALMATGAAVGFVLTVFALRLATASAPIPASPDPAPERAPVATPAPGATATPTTATAGTPSPRSGCGAVSAPLSADTDGDGCPEALRWADGTLEAGGRRWRVGQPGDRVAVAAWSCSGRATLALLRPATGDVFVFRGWAGPGEDLAARVVGRVEGGFAIRAADLGDGCPRVAVERAAGPAVTLPLLGPADDSGMAGTAPPSTAAPRSGLAPEPTAAPTPDAAGLRP